MRPLLTASLLAFGLQSSSAMAQNVITGVASAPSVPAEIQLPAGNTSFLSAHAEGTQNYICLPSATGYSWTFLGPQATLFVKFKWINGEIKHQITTHFLSPNPAEGGLPRPTWQSSLDTSAVWAKGLASSRDPNYVAPGAIPWLLLEVTGTRPGPAGGRLLTDATFLHRVNTAGGVEPSTGCSSGANVGATAMVPYTADYHFYRASRTR
jgi:hypothetical protein